MKEHPIIFSTDSVKAILDGRKTQTRRVIKFQPEPNHIEEFKETWQGLCPYGQVGDSQFTYFKDSPPPNDGYYETIWEKGDKPQIIYLRRHNLPDLPTDVPTEYEWERWLWGKDEHDDPEAIGLDIRQPELIQWRRIGGRLWVRETWATDKLLDHLPPRVLEGAGTLPFWYLADSDQHSIIQQGKWRPSIFMPRWASRITLEVIGVKVERVQEIRDTDVNREGIEQISIINAIPKFHKLWDSLNAKRGYSWKKNPWCWVISFKKEQKDE